MGYVIGGIEKETDADGYLKEADYSDEAVQVIAATEGIALGIARLPGSDVAFNRTTGAWDAVSGGAQHVGREPAQPVDPLRLQRPRA